MFTRKELTEWTSALRANPEQQMRNQLANLDYTEFCCLGKLCEIRGLAKRGGGIYAYRGIEASVGLPSPLASEFTGDSLNESVRFRRLGMPCLKGSPSAAIANDNGCTWIEIADHFDKYYPCSDEQPA